MKVLCVLGDMHGHLQLGLCMAARWQRELGLSFEAFFLCGDVGAFTSEAQLDSTTRRHSKANPCELEFLCQWTPTPQPRWIGKIFEPLSEGGLGLLCPIVMVHGNHEGFTHLERLVPESIPAGPVEIQTLPAVDSGRHIRYLPSGWRCKTSSGLLVAGIGGIERGQRMADYHPMAYIDEDAVAHLLYQPPVDLLITHQGPSGIQGEQGSDTLQLLLEAGVARVWCHGHSIPQREIVRSGPEKCVLVVPMGDIAFPSKGPEGDDPGEDGWAWLDFENGIDVCRERPEFWREYRKRRWKVVAANQLVCPDLARWA